MFYLIKFPSYVNTSVPKLPFIQQTGSYKLINWLVKTFQLKFVTLPSFTFLLNYTDNIQCD